MRFGPSSDPSRPRAFPPGVKRQLVVLTLLLAVVLVLGYRLLLELRRAESRWPSTAVAPPSAPEASDTAEVVPELVPVDPVAPEPFVENPEVLARAAAADGASEPSDEATTYFFQKVLASDVSLADREPVLDLRQEAVWQPLLDEPHAYRGKPIDVWGFVVSAEDGRRPLQMRGLTFPNSSGRDRAFFSYLYGTDDRYYLVATLEPRPEIRHRQRVRLRAYFCHLYTNDVVVDGQIRKGTVPYLVGEDYTIVEPPEGGVDLGPYLPIVVVLPLVVIVVVAVLNRRARRSYDQRRLQARREFRQQSSGKEGEQ
jgi:hypothetical protein